MGDQDSAFLWETEALRKGTSKSQPAFVSRPPVPEGEEWPTLREAEEATGIPISTLRKWIRRGRVPSYLEETHFGSVRRVSLDGIQQRADELGREIKHDTPTSTPAPEPSPVRQAEPAVEKPAPVKAVEPETPPGTMLVPIDAWDKMLMQLGNLHEAGQQLAEARERAAKAETEAEFLRERLAELRHARPVPPPLEPMDHIRIESTEDLPSEADSGNDIQVRTVKESEPSDESEPDAMEGRVTFTGYSLEMAKHIYDTWRRRPRR